MCSSVVSFFKEFLIYQPLDVISLDVSMIKSSCSKELSGEQTCYNFAYQFRWGSAMSEHSLPTSNKSLVFSVVIQSLKCPTLCNSMGYSTPGSLDFVILHSNPL